MPERLPNETIIRRIIVIAILTTLRPCSLLVFAIGPKGFIAVTRYTLNSPLMLPKFMGKYEGLLRQLTRDFNLPFLLVFMIVFVLFIWFSRYCDISRRYFKICVNCDLKG